MSDTPLVSLGLPIYNGEQFLPQMLDSILAQTYEHFELIISDNASTDGTIDICNAYAKRDSRISVHRAATNQGSAWNHRRVQELSNGPYFKWLGADDTTHARFLELTLAALLSRPEALNAYPKTVVIDDVGTEVARTTDRLPLDSPDPAVRFATLIKLLPVTHCMFYGVWRRSLMDKARRMGAFLAADRCMLAEASLYGPYVLVDEFLMYRRIHTGHKRRSQTDEQKLYVPDSRALQLRQFGVLRESLISLSRWPVSSGAKLHLLKAIGGWTVDERGSLLEELKAAVKHKVRSTGARVGMLGGTHNPRGTNSSR